MPKDRIETRKLSSMLKESDNLRETTKPSACYFMTKKNHKIVYIGFQNSGLTLYPKRNLSNSSAHPDCIIESLRQSRQCRLQPERDTERQRENQKP
jgi:hypothetical protein